MAFTIEIRNSSGTPVPAPKDLDTAVLDADNKLWVPKATGTFAASTGAVQTLAWVEKNSLGTLAGGGLPTSDPLVAGEFWVDTAASFVVKVSQGA